MLIKKTKKPPKLHDYKLVNLCNRRVASAFFYLKKYWWFINVEYDYSTNKVDVYLYSANKHIIPWRFSLGSCVFMHFEDGGRDSVGKKGLQNRIHILSPEISKLSKL